jgi:choline dehydrogenase-like flavoprotein
MRRGTNLGVWAVSAVLSVLVCCTITAYGQPYDVIIVGAGSAGAVVANFISADPSISVLLIGEGGDVNGQSGTEPQACSSPNCGINPTYEPFCEHLFTVPEPITAKQIYVPRPTPAGGSSAINTALTARGAAEWWNSLQASYGVTGWDWNSIQEVWTVIERFNASTSPLPRSPDHGYSGFIDTMLFPMTPTMTGLANSAAKINDLPIFQDANLEEVPAAAVANTERGFGYDAATGEYTRQNAFDQGVKPYLPGGSGPLRRNLVYINYAVVTKITFNSQHTVATGVQYVRLGQSFSASLVSGGQLVLAAGAIGTPKLLMLSGVGDCATLAELAPDGIPCVLNQPNIGKHWRTTMNAQMFFQGPLAEDGVAVMVDWKSSPSEPVADCEMGMDPIVNQTGLAGTTYLFQTGQMIYHNPGSLTLQDADYTTGAVPVINFEFPGCLLQAFTRARAIAADFTATTGLPFVELSPGFATVPLGDDAAALAWIAANYQIDYAYHGGVQFGGNQRVNSNSSCDYRGRMWGLPNIRIADNSIYPTHQKHASFTSALTSGGMIGKFLLEEAAAGNLWSTGPSPPVGPSPPSPPSPPTHPGSPPRP